MDDDPFNAEFVCREQKLSSSLINLVAKEINRDDREQGMLVAYHAIVLLSANIIEISGKNDVGFSFNLFIRNVSAYLKIYEAGEMTANLLQKLKAQK
jgi:hypothetical protein